MATSRTIDLALELGDLLRPFWPEFDTGPVVCEGEPDPPKDDPPKPDPPKEETFDKERALATIAAQRASEAKLKADLKEAREKAAKYDADQAEKLSEQEKLAKEAEDAKALAASAQKQLREAKLLVELAKPEHGIVNAQAAATLLLAQGAVEFGADGEPTNLTVKGADDKTPLGAFLEQNAFLKGQTQQPSQDPPPDDFGGGARGGTHGNVKLTQDELDAARGFGMTPQEYAQFRDDPHAAATAAAAAAQTT